MNIELIGGIAGGVLGLMGGILGTYYNTHLRLLTRSIN